MTAGGKKILNLTKKLEVITFYPNYNTVGTARIDSGAVRFSVRELFVGGCNFW